MNENHCIWCDPSCESRPSGVNYHKTNKDDVDSNKRIRTKCGVVKSTLTLILVMCLTSSTAHCQVVNSRLIHFHQRPDPAASSTRQQTSASQDDDAGIRRRSSGPSPYHLLFDKHRNDPFFDSNSLTNITVAEGASATYLPCTVHQLGDRTVSWIRRKDLHVLTVGKFTYTSEQRFQPVHLNNSDDWTLQIRFPQRKDEGIYECQISTLPKMSLFVNLNVIVAKSKILGGPTLYINSGSTLNLTCIVNETPDYIFWYHNGEVINYDSPRGIKVQTEKSAQTSSQLIISKSLPTDSGNYSCTPSNAEPSHIAVHIHSNPAAASIQHGKRSARNFITSSAPNLFDIYKINIHLGLPLLFALCDFR